MRNLSIYLTEQGISHKLEDSRRHITLNNIDLSRRDETTIYIMPRHGFGLKRRRGNLNNYPQILEKILDMQQQIAKIQEGHSQEKDKALANMPFLPKKWRSRVFTEYFPSHKAVRAYQIWLESPSGDTIHMSPDSSTSTYIIGTSHPTFLEAIVKLLDR